MMHKPTFQKHAFSINKMPIPMANWKSNDPFLLTDLGMKLPRFYIDGRQWLSTAEHGPAVYSCCFEVLLP
jgi:hypothetical protein